MIQKVERLKFGDKVQIIAPGSHFDVQQFMLGIDWLRSWGLHVAYRADIFERDGYLAGSDARRLEEIHEAFADSDAKAVFAARGGFGTTRLLDRLNYQGLVSRPKLLVGFSDITALLVHLVTVCHLPAIHGPLVTRGYSTEERSVDAMNLLWQLLSSDASTTIPLDGEVISAGEAEGEIIGGNLTVLQSMVGLASFPDLAGKILFLEEINEPPYRIDRMLTHFRQLGLFQMLRGVIVGELGTGDTVWEEKIVREFFAPLGVPVVMGCRIGHPIPLFSLPLGVKASLNTRRQVVEVEPLVF